MFRGCCSILRSLLIILVAIRHIDSAAVCELSFNSRNGLFNFNLLSPLRDFPHGVRSEDGFYKVAGKGTVLWFQLCDGLIFNHNPPRCVDCADCGGPSYCGTACSALVSSTIGGYDVCTTIGHVSTTKIDIIDKENPNKGVIVKMSSGDAKQNCSLSVSVFCVANGVQGPLVLERSGTCAYATALRHPSGCAAVISGHGSGWGWFGTLIITVLCLFGAYLLAGAVYRYFALGIRSIDVIPNLDIWVSVPHRIQVFFASLLQRFRGPRHGHRSSYSPVNF